MTPTSSNGPSDSLKVGLVQMAPVWLNREQTLTKMLDCVTDAARQGCRLAVFGEALLPGYPFWLELTDGARFNSPVGSKFCLSSCTFLGSRTAVSSAS